jgi:hypothetical protein
MLDEKRRLHNVLHFVRSTPLSGLAALAKGAVSGGN